MTILDMLEQSGVLTLLGMGIVFGFLIIMVIAISVAGKIIGKFVKDECVSNGVNNAAAPQKSGDIPAAISAAVNEYRKNN
jgi:oxaloacetate decarboxylase gamma subunit